MTFINYDKYVKIIYNEQEFFINKNNIVKDLVNANLLEKLDLIEAYSIFQDNQIIYNLLLQKVSLYDSSSAVNSFIYKDKELWFDKNTRASLLNAINYSKDEFTFLFGDEEVTMTVANAKKFIGELEIYAQKCFLNTQRHLRNVRAIKEPRKREDVDNFIDSLKNYDYTQGYPEKIKLG